MHSRSLKHWLAGIVTLGVFTLMLILRLPKSESVETPPSRVQPPQETPPSWPMFGGSPARNMVNTTAKNLPVTWTDDQGKLTNVLWSAQLGTRAYGGPVVAGGKVFVGTNNQSPRDPKHVDANGEPIDLGVLMVFNQTDGKFLYQSTFPKLPNGLVMDWPRQGLCSAPTVEGNRVYYTSNRCEVVCADVDTGELLWKVDMIGLLGVFPHCMTPCSPLIVGDAVYVITANGVDEGHVNLPAPKAPSFLKLEKRTGRVLWQDNSPTINFKGGGPKAFIDQVNRAEIVQHSQWSHPAYALAGGEHQIIFPAGDGWIRSFSPDGKLLWKFDGNPKDAVFGINGDNVRSHFIAAPVIYKDRIYIGVGEDPEYNRAVGHFWCIDMTKKGDVSPELVVNGQVWPPVTKPNPNSAALWHFGGLIPGKKKGRNYQFGRTMSTCAIHDDLVYISELAGWIHCLDANTGELYWQHDIKDDIWSSPYWAEGKVYLGTDGGDVWVFAHGKEKKILAENIMGRPIRTPPVAVGDVLYVVNGDKLFALKK